MDMKRSLFFLLFRLDSFIIYINPFSPPNCQQYINNLTTTVKNHCGFTLFGPFSLLFYKRENTGFLFPFHFYVYMPTLPPRFINIFIILLYISSVLTQQCLPLAESTTCSMFHSAKISIRDAKYVALPWLVNVSTISEFDHQLLNYVNSTNFWNSELGCKSATISNRARYAVSLTCATIVFDTKSSSQCSGNTTLPIPLCQSSCEAYSKSVEAILHTSSSSSICGGNMITAGSNSLSQQCKTNEGLKGIPSTGCMSAVDHEISMCGKYQPLNT